MFNERHYLNKELAAHARATEAADPSQYFRQEAKAEKYAMRADKKHEKHMARENKYLKKEALQHRLAEDSVARGDALHFNKYESRAAKYHGKAGRTHMKKHYAAPLGHHHQSGLCHEEVPMGSFGGIPPLGRAPIGGTMPARPLGRAPGFPVPMGAPMGTMGGYADVIEAPSPYFAGPPPPTVRDFDVLEWDYEYIPSNRPLGIAPEFSAYTYGPVADYW